MNESHAALHKQPYFATGYTLTVLRFKFNEFTIFMNVISLFMLQADNLILCSCKLNGLISPNKDRVKIMFCQAVDTVGNTVSCLSLLTQYLFLCSHFLVVLS